MTVGVAAMCFWEGQPSVICVSDRMITSGDIQFEPPAKKIYQLTSSSCMLIAGDSASQIELYQSARRAIKARLETDQSWMTIKEVAELVADQTISFVRSRIERTVLKPFSMSMDDFLKRQPELRQDFYDALTKDMNSCRPSNQTIVAGVDEGGAHIYEIDSFGDARCLDAAGFAAIGSGYRHVESQFMFAKHAAWKDFPETLLLTYAGKRRAEAAPGVGAETDICYVRGLGGFYTVPENSIDYLKMKYVSLQNRNDVATEEANKEIADDFKKVAAVIAEQQAAAAQKDEQGTAPPPPSPSVASEGDGTEIVAGGTISRPLETQTSDLSSSPIDATPEQTDQKKPGD